jgi:hypothetical protein
VHKEDSNSVFPLALALALRYASQTLCNIFIRKYIPECLNGKMFWFLGILLQAILILFETSALGYKLENLNVCKQKTFVINVDREE